MEIVLCRSMQLSLQYDVIFGKMYNFWLDSVTSPLLLTLGLSALSLSAETRDGNVSAWERIRRKAPGLPKPAHIRFSFSVPRTASTVGKWITDRPAWARISAFGVWRISGLEGTPRAIDYRKELVECGGKWGYRRKGYPSAALCPPLLLPFSRTAQNFATFLFETVIDIPSIAHRPAHPELDREATDSDRQRPTATDSDRQRPSATDSD